LPSYNLLDLHAGAKHGIYTIDLFVKNVTDQRAQLAAQTGQGIAEVTVARPRTIGIALTANY
jgi:outer membrane receptor protein involved in Fe transport